MPYVDDATAAGAINNVGHTLDSQLGSIQQELDELNDAQHVGGIYRELCTWAKPTYGDTGTNWQANLIQAALIGVAVLDAAMQAQISALRYEIASAYADLSKDRWNRFKNYYTALERAAMNEAGNLEDYDPDYPEALSRADVNNTAAFLAANDVLTDRAKRYALCIDETLLNDLDFAEALSFIDGINYNYRMEEYWHYYIADKNWNRRSELLNIGRGIQAISATYAQYANDALKTVGEFANAGAQGAMKLFGYLGAVAETQYPAVFSAASPMTGSAGSLGSALLMGAWGS